MERGENIQFKYNLEEIISILTYTTLLDTTNIKSRCWFLVVIMIRFATGHAVPSLMVNSEVWQRVGGVHKLSRTLSESNLVRESFKV